METARYVLLGLDSKISRDIIGRVVTDDKLIDVVSPTKPNRKESQNRGAALTIRFQKFVDNSVVGAALANTIFLPIGVCFALLKIGFRQVRLQYRLRDLTINSVVVDSTRSMFAPLDAMLFGLLKGKDVYLWMYANPGRKSSLVNVRQAPIYRSLWTRKVVRYYRLADSIALHLIGLHPKNPWVYGTGRISSIFVDTGYDKGMLVASGVREDKIRIIGTPQLDVVLSNFNAGRRIKEKCVIALPQLFEHNLADQRVAFDVVRDLVEAAASVFGETVISLHPKMNPAVYKDLLCDYDVSISDTSIEYELLDATTHISVYSSTVKLAIAAGLNVVIYDPVGLNYSWFYEEFMIPRFNTPDTLRAGLEATKNVTDASVKKRNFKVLAAESMDVDQIYETLRLTG